MDGRGEYDWTVTGGTVVNQDGNQISIIWGPAGVGTIHVEYESPFLGGLQGHAYPDCSGAGDLTVEILPELVFLSAPNQACADQSLTFQVNDASRHLVGQRPGHGNCLGRPVHRRLPQRGHLHRHRDRHSRNVLQPRSFRYRARF